MNKTSSSMWNDVMEDVDREIIQETRSVHGPARKVGFCNLALRSQNGTEAVLHIKIALRQRVAR